jgi:hypothetical protein
VAVRLPLSKKAQCEVNKEVSLAGLVSVLEWRLTILLKEDIEGLFV